MAGVQALSKISAKTCKATPEMELVTVDGKQVPRAKGEQHLLRIVGMTNGIKMGNSEYGKWTAFVGSFEATNVKTGEIFRSSKCLLPEAITGQLAIAVESASENNPVQFALDIGVKPATTPTGYEYTITSLMDVSESDPLEMMKKQLQLPALTAPAPAPALVAPVDSEEVAETKTEKSASKKK